MTSGSNLVFAVIFKCCPRTDVVSVVIALHSICAVSLFLFPVVPLYPVLLAHCAIFGLAMSTATSMIPLLFHLFVDSDDLTLGFGFGIIPIGIGSVVGPLLAGLLFDKNSSYIHSFYIPGLAYVICNIFLLQPCISRLRTTRMKAREHGGTKHGSNDGCANNDISISSVQLQLCDGNEEPDTGTSNPSFVVDDEG